MEQAFTMSLTMMIEHAISKASNVLVITHVDPDGDAIGSLTAVGLMLLQQGKQITLACDDNVPERFQYLSLTERVQKKLSNNAQYDLIIGVDCGDELRMGNVYANFPHEKPMIINIDHHITNTEFGNLNLVNPTATSTTEMLFTLFQELEIEITTELAQSLLTGLVTDTLAFRVVGVTAKTLEVASALMKAGANLPQITMKALNIRPYSTLRLWRTGLNHVNLEDGVAWSTISNQEREKAGFRGQSSGGLVNFLADVQEAGIGVVLMEVDDGAIRVGFRARPPYDVSVIARKLGGGGHPLASGCTLNEPLEVAETIIVEACKEAIRQTNNET